jgi:hypothetical protein
LYCLSRASEWLSLIFSTILLSKFLHSNIILGQLYIKIMSCTHISYSADQSRLSAFDTFQFCRPRAR